MLGLYLKHNSITVKLFSSNLCSCNNTYNIVKLSYCLILLIPQTGTAVKPTQEVLILILVNIASAL